MVQVFLGGMLGTIIRYMIFISVSSLTMLWIVNLTGSFLLGLFNGIYEKKYVNHWRLFWTTGFFGSFTTFSSFSEQWFTLLKENVGNGLLFGISMPLLCVMASFIGYKLVR